MSRFEYAYEDGEGMPYGLWEANVSRALGGRRGQAALAALEEALLALPEPKLIEGHLVAEGGVCAIGALVVHQRAQAEGVDIGEIIAAMSTPVRCSCGHSRDKHGDDGCAAPHYADKTRTCACDEFYPEEEDPWETVAAGQRAGLRMTLAWHLADMNDERFRGLPPEERFEKMLAFVRRAQGKDAVAA